MVENDQASERVLEHASLTDYAILHLAATGAPGAAWAGMLVVGDGQLAPVQPRNGFWSRAGVIALVVLAVVAAFVAVKFFVNR